MMAPEFTIKYLRFFMLSSLFSLGLVGALLKFQIFGASEGGFVFEEEGSSLENTLRWVFLGVSVVFALVQSIVPQRLASPVSGEVIRLALCEAIGILGFVLFLLGGDASWALAFGMCSAVLMVAGRRSESSL